MLRLKDIRKNYVVAGEEIEVLKGLNISFRRNEFVSILGPSGCGKTTTLNIIGGLDKYTSGDLIIAGKSTKNFKDHDWDIYRNQRIGFVFQSYNLIPHQTVLGNVELALTISGVSKEERTKMAYEALEKVGLKGQEHKRPNQLSGGQCQRVAIARAIVNKPEILLADEPTGALDAKTSIQIMDLIKEISKDRLVIMVTHNPDLANEYSTRIIRLLDGEVTEDTNPYSEEDEIAEVSSYREEKANKAKMSWWTAFKLSARNLLSKRGRTILTCIAGSIGIVGVSSVLAVSNGVKEYIASMQDDMLSGNPITISEQGMDYSAIMESFSNVEKELPNQVKDNAVIDNMIEYVVDRYSKTSSSFYTNNITEDYVHYLENMPSEYYSAYKYSYGINMDDCIYTSFETEDGSKSDYSVTGIKTIYTSLLNKTKFSKFSSMIGQLSNGMMQAPNNSEYILSQYDLLAGDLASGKNQIMLVLDKNNAVTDITLGQLGYLSQNEFLNIAYRSTGDEKYSIALDKFNISYNDLLAKKFYFYPNNSIYTKNDSITIPTNQIPFNYLACGDTLAKEDALELEVVGILKPKDNINYGCLTSGVYYTQDLTDYILAANKDSEIVTYMKDNSIPRFPLDAQISSPIAPDTKINVHFGVKYYVSYVYENTLEQNEEHEYGVTNYNLSSESTGGDSSTTNPMEQLMGMITSASQEAITVRTLGGNTIPSKVTVYPVNFEKKDLVTNYLDAWNSNDDISVTYTNGDETITKVITKENRDEIKYSDSLAIVIQMINSMIDIITIALVAFTALSLVVSCVMIAIITYVSVVERVKEIGVIRSLGGRKKDVSNLFNAETLMIGAASGLFGVLVTYILSLIANLIVSANFGISVIASLPILTALFMVLLSILLTVISGLIPASKASRQDPVNALRSE